MIAFHRGGISNTFLVSWEEKRETQVALFIHFALFVSTSEGHFDLPFHSLWLSFALLPLHRPDLMDGLLGLP